VAFPHFSTGLIFVCHFQMIAKYFFGDPFYTIRDLNTCFILSVGNAAALSLQAPDADPALQALSRGHGVNR
jgi:hypothetical protein